MPEQFCSSLPLLQSRYPSHFFSLGMQGSEALGPQWKSSGWHFRYAEKKLTIERPTLAAPSSASEILCYSLVLSINTLSTGKLFLIFNKECIRKRRSQNWKLEKRSQKFHLHLLGYICGILYIFIFFCKSGGEDGEILYFYLLAPRGGEKHDNKDKRCMKKGNASASFVH